MKTVIVGAGFVAGAHANALKEIGVDVVGVVDLDLARAAALAERVGARTSDRIDDFLAEVDMVHLCTPPFARREPAIAAIEAGKHLLIEKPMASNIADAVAILEASRRSDAVLMVGFNHRYRRGFQALLSVAKSDGRIGEITSIYSYRHGLQGGAAANNWRLTSPQTVGMTVESLSHELEMLWELGGEVASLDANVRSTIPQLATYDDNAEIIMELESGAGAVIHASWSSNLPFSARGVIGTRGSAMLTGNGIFDFETLRTRFEGDESETIEVIGDRYEYDRDDSYVLENRHFLKAIADGTTPITSGELGVLTMRLSQAILDASANRTRIAVAPVH